MRKLIALVLGLVLAAVAAWLVASHLESPAQVAARARPPAPKPVMAPLQRGYLQGAVSLSATAQHERTVEVKPPAALAGQVVTFAGKGVGETLTAGSVLLRANGRPVFVLPGSFALYRNLQPGDTGDDVAAVQAGLNDH